MFRALLDTCALIPGRQRDFLLQLAAEQTYQVLWSSGTVDDELVEVLLRLDEKRGRPPDRSKHEFLVDQMKLAFPGATIAAPRARTYTYGLTDPGDGHVAHAAIMGQASAIVTRDRHAGFDTCTALTDAQIEILTPDEFRRQHRGRTAREKRCGTMGDVSAAKQSTRVAADATAPVARPIPDVRGSRPSAPDVVKCRFSRELSLA